MTIPVHSFALNTNDAVFDPVAAGFAKVDAPRALTDVEGQLGSGAALDAAFNAELSLIRSVVFDYPLGQQPPRPTPDKKTDPTAAPILLAASATPGHAGMVIDVGGLATAENASDPFVMEYAAGMPLDQVGWGRLSPNALSQQTRLVNLHFAINMRSPYLARVQSSNAASHVLRSMEQAVIGDDVPGAFGDKEARTIVVVSSDAYVAGLAGLLGLHWALPGYQPDFCAPGGALVFELRQSRRSREFLVRAYYTAQTFDQLRDLTPLTLTEPPATVQLRIPVDRPPGESPDVRFDVFQRALKRAMDQDCVEDPATEIQPGVLTDVPLK